MSRLLNNKIAKRALYVLIFLALWQTLFSARIAPEILFPSPAQVISALFGELADGSMAVKTGYTFYLIFSGLIVSFAITAVLAVLSACSAAVKDFARFLISVLDPLPGIALLPIAILWFGIGKASIIFIMVHSIVWPSLLSVMSGFDSIPKIYREVGENIGLSKFRIVKDIYVPAAFPSILMGVKNGWARAWRALIAAEMVFSAAGASGGLGWDIYIKRSYYDMPGMFATLIILMFIGILVEDTFFYQMEKRTVRKWGMVS